MDTSLGAPQVYPSTPGMYNLTTQADGHKVAVIDPPAGAGSRTVVELPELPQELWSTPVPCLRL